MAFKLTFKLDSLPFNLKYQELRDNKMFCIHFILTFDDKFEHGGESKQQMFMQLVPECSSDEEFLTNFFGTMRHDELMHLIKISTCIMYINDESDIPAFLKECGGNYFFNVSVNKDDHSKTNRKLLDRYLRKNY